MVDDVHRAYGGNRAIREVSHDDTVGKELRLS